MADITIATVQFEHASGDKKQNLRAIRRLSAQAAAKGAKVVAFHECSISGYAFARHLDKQQLCDVAELVPEGPSCQELVSIAKQHDVAILAGLFEIDSNAKLYNTYVAATADGIIARFRKIHPFINADLSAGNEYVVFDLYGWKCGILICYDNNVVENVRATSLLGAEIIFMPHVTMCTPSTRPGAGFVSPELWHNRRADPTTLRADFHGLKGRAWLMKWLPSRAYDNAVYAIFSNPIGMDDDQLKPGCSMILDPFGDVLNECRALDEDLVLALCTKDKLYLAGGHRYRLARRPALYSKIIGETHHPEQSVVWLAGSTKAERS